MNTDVKVLSLTNNVMFKELFGQEDNKKALTFIISNCFDLDYNFVYDNIKYLNTRLNIDNKNDYKFDSDVMVNLNNEILISVEMNKEFWTGLDIRNISYGTKLFTSQFRSSKKSKKVFKYAKPMIQLNFNNYNFPLDKEIEIYSLKGETNVELTDKIKIVQINLAKIKNKGYNDVSELSGIERVCKFLVSDNIEEMRKLVGDGMEDIIQKIIDLSNDERIIGLYNREELQEEIRETMIDDAFENGVNQNKIEVAKKLLSMNMTIEDISKVTNLTIDEIKNLK